MVFKKRRSISGAESWKRRKVVEREQKIMLGLPVEEPTTKSRGKKYRAPVEKVSPEQHDDPENVEFHAIKEEPMEADAKDLDPEITMKMENDQPSSDSDNKPKPRVAKKRTVPGRSPKDKRKYRYKDKSAQPADEAVSFCALCVRECAPKSLVTFSKRGSWYSPQLLESQERIEMAVGISVDLTKRNICRTCWGMVELIMDFRACCQKAADWMSLHEFGLERDEKSKADLEGWLSNETNETIDGIRMTIRDHVARIEADELAVREAQDRFDFVELKPKSEHAELMGEASGSGKLSAGVDGDDVNSDDFEHSLDDILEQALTENDNSNSFEANFERQEGPSKSKDSANHDDQSNDNTESAETQVLNMDVPIFTCDKCNRAFDSKSGRSIHKTVCDGSDKNPTFHKCTICLAEFVRARDLRTHINKHRGIKSFKCQKACSRSFYTVIQRTVHERFCGSQNYICSLCGTTLKNLQTLNSHMASVHGEATLPCSVCQLKFRTRKHLNRHMAVHSEERAHPCTVCGKAFKTAYTLRVHMRIHTDEKPFSCTICGERFAYKCLVQPHVQRAHGGGGE